MKQASGVRQAGSAGQAEGDRQAYMLDKLTVLSKPAPMGKLAALK